MILVTLRISGEKIKQTVYSLPVVYLGKTCACAGVLHMEAYLLSNTCQPLLGLLLPALPPETQLTPFSSLGLCSAVAYPEGFP